MYIRHVQSDTLASEISWSSRKGSCHANQYLTIMHKEARNFAINDHLVWQTRLKLFG
jgi:hypothetical protein